LSLRSWARITVPLANIVTSATCWGTRGLRATDRCTSASFTIPSKWLMARVSLVSV